MATDINNLCNALFQANDEFRGAHTALSDKWANLGMSTLDDSVWNGTTLEGATTAEIGNLFNNWSIVADGIQAILNSDNGDVFRKMTTI